MSFDDLFPKIDISDYEEIIANSPTSVIEVDLCSFKECLQLKSTNFFCNDHYDLIYRPRKKQKNMIKSDDQCAAKRCFKKHEDESYLCMEHIMATTVNVQARHQCTITDCTRVKEWKKHCCLFHS